MASGSRTHQCLESRHTRAARDPAATVFTAVADHIEPDALP
jgi:hypothetical protein